MTAPRFSSIEYKQASIEVKKYEMPICPITLEDVVNLKEPRIAKDGRIYEQEAILEYLTKSQKSPINPSLKLTTRDVFKSPDLESLIECHHQLQKNYDNLLATRNISEQKPSAFDVRNQLMMTQLIQMRKYRVNAFAISWRLRVIAKKLKNAKSLADQANYSMLPKMFHKVMSYLPVMAQIEQKYDQAAKNLNEKYTDEVKNTKLSGISKTLLKGMIAHKIVSKTEETLRELSELQAKEYEAAAKQVRESMVFFGRRKSAKDEGKLSFLSFIRKDDKSSPQDALNIKLYEAVSAKDTQKVLTLYKQGADVNGVHPLFHLAPLFVAIKNLDFVMVRFLLGLGADSSLKLPKVSFTDKNKNEVNICEVGTSPLIFLMILSQDFIQTTYADAEKIFNVLLEHKADINAADCKYNTALHYAVKLGDTCLTQMLLKNHANPLLVNCYDRTPLEELRYSEKIPKVKLTNIQDLLIEARSETLRGLNMHVR